MLKRRSFPDREAWLAAREEHPGIGASEAAAALGLSCWSSPTQLWREKTGRSPPKDISENSNVRFGTAAEEHLRALFMLQHPELRLEYHAFDFLYQEGRPWLRCTLDGELTDTASGERGVLEIKTAELSTRADWEAWKERIPDHYLTQILHQLSATGFSFAYVYAMLKALSGGAELRTYYFRREDYKNDINWLLDGEKRFWDCVVSGKLPGAILTL